MPKKCESLAGKQFGEWTVLREAEPVADKRRWHCQCSCGVERDVYQDHLRRGMSTSCGLGHMKLPRNTPGRSSWVSMLSRCRNKNHEAYHRYGGRGITVCQRWQDGFDNFYADMGPRPDGMSLERIDSNGNYEPDNCKWATTQEQQNNTCTNRFIEVDGERLTVAQLARKQNVKYETMYSRLKRAGVV